jgi:hypothetical protein
MLVMNYEKPILCNILLLISFVKIYDCTVQSLLLISFAVIHLYLQQINIETKLEHGPPHLLLLSHKSYLLI